MKSDLNDQVSNYFGKIIQNTACCSDIEYPAHIKEIPAGLHDETMAKYYGYGLIVPSKLKGSVSCC